jgi:chromosome partitioning protein
MGPGCVATSYHGDDGLASWELSCYHYAMPDDLRVLALLGQKGGSGKTTLAVHVGVAAQEAGWSVAILDTDPQASAHAWVSLRANGDPAVARLRPDQVDTYVEKARGLGVRLLVVDTAPHASTSVYNAIVRADLVLLPCRPTVLDLSSIERAVTIAQAAKRAGAFVMNACAPRCEETALSRNVLESYPFPLAPIAIGQRQAYVRAMSTGQAVTEFETNGKAAAEMRGLWSWIAGRLG